MIETLDRPLVPEEGGDLAPTIYPTLFPTLGRPAVVPQSCSFPILASNGFCVEGDQRSSSRKPVEISLRPPLVDPNPVVWLNSSLRGIMSTLPKGTVGSAKPYDFLLKLNFGEGCSCVCTQIKFTVDFQPAWISVNLYLTGMDTCWGIGMALCISTNGGLKKSSGVPSNYGQQIQAMHISAQRSWEICIPTLCSWFM